MRILHIFNFLSPNANGTITLIRQLSLALAKRGHEVGIFTSDFELSKEYIDSLKPVRIYAHPSWLNLPGLYLYLSPGMISETKRIIKDFDIVHLHCFRSLQNIVVCHYAKKYGVPYVLQAHGSLKTFFYKGWLKRTFDTVWGNRILRDASKVIAVTKAEAEQFKSMGVSQHKIEIVHNAIDFSEFDHLPRRGAFKTKYGLNTDNTIILFVGRIHKIKGLDLLCKAFADLTKILDGIILVIAGPDDGYLTFLKKLVNDLKISNKVLFTGPLYGKEKLEAYVDAKVCVLPSLYEIFGITLLEALACCTPVIVTDRCGLADVVNGEAGLVVSYDRDQLQHALLRMLSHEKMRRRFGAKGKLLVHEKFSLEKIAEQVEGVYRGVQHG